MENEEVEEEQKKLDDKVILLIGLDYAGKSTLINNYFFGELLTFPPTKDVDEFEHEFFGKNLIIKDLGGSYRYMDDWPKYFDNVDGVIWVVDSIDKARLSESYEELLKLFEDDRLKNLPFLIVFTKQDSKYVMSWEEIEQEFKFECIKSKNINHRVIRTMARTCQFVTEGISWLVSEMK